MHIPPQLRTPPKKEKGSAKDGQPGENELLGPCSFDNCHKYAFYNCYWPNKWTLRGGGCDELYCDDHAFFLADSPTPICCKDCEKQYHSDKKRVKVFMGVSIIAIALFALIVIIIMVLILGGGKGTSTSVYNLVPIEDSAAEGDSTDLDFNTDVKDETVEV